MDVVDFNKLIFFVNGKKIIEEAVDPEWTLIYYLRNKLRLCGTKSGCDEGGCGTCTVMVSKYDRVKNKIDHIPVNACLAPVCSMHGLAVTTVEGIGSIRTTLHPVQERIAKLHGSQCGFCTPGIVMSMYTLLRNMDKPSIKDIEIAFQGNLCRCTGYRPIIEAFKTFSEDWEIAQKVSANGSCAMGENCCKNKNNQNQAAKLYDKNEFTPLNPDQELLFPPELQLNDILDRQELHFKGNKVSWYRPTNLKKLLLFKSQNKESKLVVGNTEIGVEVKYKNLLYPTLISPKLIAEMTGCTKSNSGLTVGAAVTLDELEALLNEEIKAQPEYKTRIFQAIVDMLQYFAGKQIRSVASIGGNIMTGSPISDLNPIFMAAQIELLLENVRGCRIVKMDEHFYTGYRTTILEKDEILVSIKLPYTAKDQHFFAHKQARRRDDDIAIVNSAINISFDNSIIKNISLAFGGVAATTKLALTTSQNLKGKIWDENILELAYKYLSEDLALTGNAPGGLIEYRRTLPLSFFFRSYMAINKQLNKIDRRDLSALDKLQSKIPRSSHFFQAPPPNQDKIDPIGRPIMHQSAIKQATGEAIYLDDIPHYENELHMAFVFSQKSHAKIKSLNFEPALEVKGVFGFISAEDVKGRNTIGTVFKDEELFRTETVTSQHQFLGAILAVDPNTAKSASRKVQVVYEDIDPVVVTIEDAIKHRSFFSDVQRKLECGNIDSIMREAKHVIEGECRSGYQEHFYLETHGCIVIPKDNDELEVVCCTQNHTQVAEYIATTLNMPRNKIVAKIKRIGGGFGGKESKGAPIALAAAVASKKFNRPVRVVLDRNEDMAHSGGRHAFLSQYKVAFDDSGRILGLDLQFYSNCGYSMDLSLPVMERALFHADNAYKIPNLRVNGTLCKTNLPTNTVFRGSGSPQAMYMCENVIRDVADFLQMDSIEIAKLNLYKEDDVTHYNQPVSNCNVQQCLQQCLETSDYYKRKNEIEIYNKNNRWKKRGISTVCSKFAVGFAVRALEQAGALIVIYTDGTVLLSHGGVELGQGLNTKMIQVASRVLKIPHDKIHIAEFSTDKVPNTSPTAASLSSDLNGMAVMNACDKIMQRLKPIIEQNPKGAWEDWINAAYTDRISLSATGFYVGPDVGFDWDTQTGTPYDYFTCGVACTEVEIDCLTGDHLVLRTDIVMDLGSSLNPAIDIGQIEGAFVQGYGFYVMEEMLVSPTGTIHSRGPGTYKIPGFSDIPLELNIALLEGTSNPRAVYSSKAVGEPPYFLASSALFAIREAIKSARIDAGVDPNFRLNAPATVEKIRMACSDRITDKAQKLKDDEIPWNVTL